MPGVQVWPKAGPGISIMRVDGNEGRLKLWASGESQIRTNKNPYLAMVEVLLYIHIVSVAGFLAGIRKKTIK